MKRLSVRKILALLCALCLLMGSLPMEALAEAGGPAVFGVAIVNRGPELIEGTLQANENVYVTGLLPVGGIAEATPVTVDSPDGNEVILAYDVKIYDGESQRAAGNPWQPGESVQVHFRSPLFDHARELRVYHLPDEAAQPIQTKDMIQNTIGKTGVQSIGKAQSTQTAGKSGAQDDGKGDADNKAAGAAEYIGEVTAQDGWVAFDAAGFSVYLVTGIIEKDIEIEGKTYRVSLSYGPDAGIPDGATLDVQPSEDMSIEDAAAMMGYGEDAIVFYVKMLNISIMYEGQEIEPTPGSKVTVTVKLLDAEEGASIDVFHLTPAQGAGMASEMLESTMGQDGSVTFTTESFSLFGFGSAAKELFTWTTELLENTFFGKTEDIQASHSAVEVAAESIEKGVTLLDAFSVTRSSDLWLRIKSIANLMLGDLESLSLYTVVNGRLGELVREGLKYSDILELSLADFNALALVRDSGLRELTREAGAVLLSGMMPKNAVVDVREAQTALVLEDGEEALASYDISIMNGNVPWQPDEAVTVELACPAAAQAIAAGYGVELWHVKDDGTSERVAYTLNGEKLAFAATGFSEYTVVRTVIEKTISTPDGKDYKITVTYDTNSHLPEGVDLDVTEVDAADYQEAAAAAAENEENLTALKAFDISIITRDEEGNVTFHQPDGNVDVSIELAGRGELAEPRVLHMDADGSVKDVIVPEMTAEEDGVSLSFQADSFSVYVIIEHEGITSITTPRVEFHYISPDYTENYNEGHYSYTAPGYEFLNKNGQYHISQILKNGEALEQIINPPNKKDINGAETSFFYGWYTVDKTGDTIAWNSEATSSPYYTGTITYSWPDPKKVDDQTPITITDDGSPAVGEQITWTIGSTTGTGVLDAEGTAHVYLVPVYQDFYFVNFHMGDKNAEEGLRNNLLTRRLVVFGQSDSMVVRIGDVECPSSDPAHQIFAGWETITDSNETDVYYETMDSDGNEITKTMNGNTEIASAGTGYYITVSKSGSAMSSLDIYPVFAEARWLYYDLGETGNGAVYVPAAYKLTNDEGKGTYFESPLPTSLRSGYSFGGWYINAAMEDSEIKNLNGSYDLVFSTTANNVTTTITTHYNQAIQLTDASGAFVAAVKGKVFYSDTNDETGSETDVNSKIYMAASLPSGDNYQKLFEITSDGKLYFYKNLDSLTVGANWVIDQQTTIRVIIWKQKVTDDKNTTKTPVDLLNWLKEDSSRKAEDYPYAVKDYDYEIFYTKSNQSTASEPVLTNFSGTYLDSNGNTQSYSGNLLNRSYTGFHYSCNDVSVVGTPNPDGTSVYNVYYDRDLRAINFYYSGITPSVTYYDAYTYTVTTANSGTQYGIVNDQYVRLTYDSATGTWTAPAYAYQYQVDNTNGTYGLVDGNYVELTPVYGSATVYTLTSTLTAGNDYLIVSRNSAGSGYALGHSGTTVARDTVTINNGTAATNNVNYIASSDVDATSVWTAGSGYKFINGQYYIRNNSNTLEISSNSSNWYWTANSNYLRTGANSGRYLAYDDSQSTFRLRQSPNSIYLYQKTTTPVIVGYTYDDNGTPTAYTGDRYSYNYVATGGTTEYTATRFTRSNNTLGSSYHLVTWSGLYGQSLAQNGYSWDDVSAYYWREGTSPGSGTGQTFLDSFIQETNPYNLVTNQTSGSFTLYHYRQQLDGTYTIDDREEAHLTLGTGSTTFNLTNKFDGFTVNSYNVGTNGFSSTGGNSTGSSVSIRSSDGALHVYHTRNQYTLTFDMNYPVDASLSYSNGQSSNLTVSNIYYESPLSAYGSTRTNNVTHWYCGVSDDSNTADNVIYGPDHYFFKGWYEDASCTVAFNFDSTMPVGNKIVYAKWAPEEFMIRINPNGAEIDHINHNGGYLNAAPLIRTEITYTDSENNTVVERPADSGYRTDQSTYFFADYGESIGQYAVSRSYVPIGDTAAAVYTDEGRHVYAYVNIQYLGGTVDGEWGVPYDLRNALYVDATGGTGQYRTDNPSQETELYTLYKFYHDWINSQYATRPGYWDCDGAKELSFSAWKNLFVAGGDDPQLYRKCNGKETWVFLGWFKDGASMPYNFSDPVTEAFKLTAHWRLDGGYTIQYTPEYWLESTDGNTYLINGDMEAWVDPMTGAAQLSYTDGAKTSVYKQPTNLTKNGSTITDHSVNFLGWRLVSVSTTTVNGNTVVTYTPLEFDTNGNPVYYDPNDDFVIDVQYADSNNVLHMQAVYEEIASSVRRPEIANLTLDANSGYLVDANGDDLTADANLAWDGVGTVLMNKNDNQIVFGDIQSSEAVHLYQYATDDADTGLTDGNNYFKHPYGYFLLGFDDDPDEQDYIATYPADSIISVQRTDDEKIYAVWEPMYYLTLKNETGVGPVTFGLNSTDSEALTVINVANGMFDRHPLSDYNSITLKSTVDSDYQPGDDTITLAFPKSAEKDIVISGTNTLGVGKVLIWNSSLDLLVNGTTTSYDTRSSGADVTYSHTAGGSNHSHTLVTGEVNNNKPFSFTESLIVNKNAVTVTFTSRNNAYALVLQDNWNGDGTGGGTQEIDYALVDIQPDNSTTPPTPKSQALPTTSTRIGYSFVGWATTVENAANGIVEYGSSNSWTIPDLNKDNGFFSTATEVEGVFVRTLYAVWEASTDAIYVFKDVPTPGNQDQGFEFTVSLGGTYSYNNNTTTISGSKTFRLAHGEYLRIKSSNYNGTPNADLGVVENANTTAYLQSEVEVYHPETDSQTGVTSYVNVLSDTIRWEQSVKAQYNNQLTACITVTETEATYYNTTVTLSAETENNIIAVDGNRYSKSALPKTETARTASWSNTDAGGTVIFTNTRQACDITVNKTMVSNISAAMSFGFTGSYSEEYTDTAGNIQTATTSLAAFNVTSGDSYLISDIPVGATLTITETENSDYTTTVSVNGNSAADGRVATFPVTPDSTVDFTNTVKSYPVKLVKVDQDWNPTVEAIFSLSASSYSLGKTLLANSSNSGVFYNSADSGSQPFYAGETYTLKETFVETGYIGLSGEVTITVSGNEANPFTFSDANVTAEKDGNVWVIKVKNQAEKDITIVKSFNDPLVTSSRTFKFSYSYQFGGKTESGTFTLAPASGSAINHVLTVPVGATDLVITELRTNSGTDNFEWVANDYDTTVALNSSPAETGWSYTISSVSDAATITFTNTRKTNTVTVQKEVSDPGDANAFNFKATLTYGGAIRNYTVDSAKNLTTDSNGQVTFTLSHNGVQTLTIPQGAKLVVAETPVDGYTPSASSNEYTDDDTEGGSFTISAVNVDGTVIFTNRKGAILTVEKRVIGVMGDTRASNTFDFSLSVEGVEKSRFTLYHGQSTQIEVPLGKLITLTEQRDGNNFFVSASSDPASMTVTVNGKVVSFTIPNDATNVKVTVKNDFPAIAPTGLSFDDAPFLLMAAAGMALILISAVGRKRRKEEE